MEHPKRLKLHNCKEIVCISVHQSPFKIKEFVNNLHIRHNHSIVIDHFGNIEAVGPVEEIDKEYANATF